MLPSWAAVGAFAGLGAGLAAGGYISEFSLTNYAVGVAGGALAGEASGNGWRGAFGGAVAGAVFAGFAGPIAAEYSAGLGPWSRLGVNIATNVAGNVSGTIGANIAGGNPNTTNGWQFAAITGIFGPLITGEAFGAAALANSEGELYEVTSREVGSMNLATSLVNAAAAFVDPTDKLREQYELEEKQRRAYEESHKK